MPVLALPSFRAVIIENRIIFLCVFDFCKHLEILVFLLIKTFAYHFQELRYVERF
jgi:hypothetical protein